MVLNRGCIDLIDSDFSAGEAGIDIAPTLVARFTIVGKGVGVRKTRHKIELRPGRLVVWPHDRCAVLRLVQSLRDDQRDWLVVIEYFAILQEGQPALCSRQLQRVGGCDDGQHSGRSLGILGFEPGDAATWDCTHYQGGIGQPWRGKFRGILCCPRDLGPAINPREGIANTDHCVFVHANPPALVSARTMERRAISTLKAFSRYAFAPATASRAAISNSAGLAFCPDNIRSAASARHGL